MSIKYVLEMLPIVRPYEYRILQELLSAPGGIEENKVRWELERTIRNFDEGAFAHALHYMFAEGFIGERDGVLSFEGIRRDVAFEDYLRDLLEYGLGKYDCDFSDPEPGETFHLWAKYRKEQVQQLLLNNPKDIMLGTKIYDGIVYAYITVIKGNSVKENLKYKDGYIDSDTFQWETVANVSDRELNALKSSKRIHIFVRKVENEDGIQLPFTYIGAGRMEYIENSRQENGSHLFRIPMEHTAPEDLYFDFRLPG